MEFKVPQFIDIEDKIAGPFTFAQLVFIVGGLAMSYVIWTILPPLLTFIKVPLVALVAALSLSLTFYPKEKHGRPFVEVLESGLKFFFLKNKLYTWKRVPKEQVVTKKEPEKTKISINVPSLSESKLKNLSWSLDVKRELDN